MTEQETFLALAPLKAAWPDRTVTRETARVYWFALEDLPADLVDAAIRRWLRSGKGFPAPAEIRALALEDAAALPPAEVAWEEVRRQIAAVGSYGVPRWSSRALEQTVAALGWRELCHCEEDDLGTLRAQFRGTYDAYRRRLTSGDAGQALTDAARRAAVLAVPSPAPALPAAPPDWQQRYQTLGQTAPATLDARARFERGKPERPAAPPPPPDPTALLAMLAATPGWQSLPAERRRAHLERYLARHPEQAAAEGWTDAFLGEAAERAVPEEAEVPA